MHPNRPTREVIIVTQEFHPIRGGIATVAEEMARAAANLGHSVEVWAQRTTSETPKTWPFSVRRLPVDSRHGPINRLRLAVELIRRRRRLNEAVVYLVEPGPMMAWMLLPSFCGIHPPRLVLTFHGSEILRFHANPLLRLLTRRLVRKASCIGTLACYTRQLLAERFPEAEAKTLLTPGALRTDFTAGPRSTPKNRSDKLVVLTVGRLHPRKGQLLTLQALQALPAALRERIEYRLVGPAVSASYERALHAAAAQPGLTVRFLGNLPDDQLATVYDEADVFALTSIDHGKSVEGFGLVYLEASARGLPVIAHRVGGVAEAVDEGRTGLLVAPGKPAALTEAFRTLLEDSDLRRRMGEAGPDWARRHTWTRAAELLFNDEPPAGQTS
ncbi:MAG: glycosyltransferase family 4 protein [Rariglobus sp.]|nr:glycosyltransferase family 4 protein [Rariglobus sp.]